LLAQIRRHHPERLVALRAAFPELIAPSGWLRVESHLFPGDPTGDPDDGEWERMAMACQAVLDRTDSEAA
jgi:hypothetical protein